MADKLNNWKFLHQLSLQAQLVRRAISGVLVRTFMILATVAGIPLAAVAAPAANEDIRAHNIQVLAKSPSASGVFNVQSDGRVLHIQSGLTCPAALPNLSLWHLQVFSPPGLGTDVGCDYGRADAQGKTVTKLTVFAVKSDGASLDKAFSKYQAELLKSEPSARYTGPAMTVSGDDVGPNQIGDYRSAEYALEVNGQKYNSDLLVVVRSGWIAEIRGTYPTEVDVYEKQPGSVALAAAVVGDAATPSIALIEVLHSLGVSQPR